jgi:nucleotide-binding universal stress UspA family protein
MIAAFCFDGVEDEELVNAGRSLLTCFSTIESLCAYGDAAEHLLSDVARQHHGAPHPRPHHQAIDAIAADGIARRGVSLLEDAGVSATPRTIGSIDPERALADASGSDRVLVLLSGHRGGVGPRSLGHVARFVIDHAHGPVLLLRRM